MPSLRDQLVNSILEWQEKYGNAPHITSTISEYDAARLIGMSEEEFAARERGGTPSSREFNFIYREKRYRVQGKRRFSDRPGSTAIHRKPANYEWDYFIWILYNKSYEIEEAYLWEVAAYKENFDQNDRMPLRDMRSGQRLIPLMNPETEPEINSAAELIDWICNVPVWFHDKWVLVNNLEPDGDGFCQCGSEKVIAGSSNPNLMLAFLMVGSLIDQIMFTYFQDLYPDFRSSFKYTKMHGHGGGGMAHPRWLARPRHRQNMDWDLISKVSEVLLNDLYDWFRSHNLPEKMRDFQKKLKEEICLGFEPADKDKLLSIIERVEKE
jgi:hypothetical protein